MMAKPMDELVKNAESGRWDVFAVAGLLFALVWVVRQWRQSEKDKDALHEARLTDAKEMVTLATEVKNVIVSLVRSREG